MYFEQNLTLQIEIFNKKNKKSYDLVQLNTQKQVTEEKTKLFSKSKSKYKKLSADEIKKKKIDIKKKTEISLT